jgi:hypothetical protein
MPEDIRRALAECRDHRAVRRRSISASPRKVHFAQKIPTLDSLEKHLGMFASQCAGSGSGISIILHLGWPDLMSTTEVTLSTAGSSNFRSKEEALAWAPARCAVAVAFPCEYHEVSRRRTRISFEVVTLLSSV